MKTTTIILLAVLALILGFMYYKCKRQSKGFQQNVQVIIDRLDIEYKEISKALNTKLPEDVRSFYVERKNHVAGILNTFYGENRYI